MAMLFTVGISIFHMGDYHRSVGVEFIGLMFGFLSLICDCFVSHYQTKRKHTITEHFLNMSLGSYVWCLFFSFILSLIKNEFWQGASFISEHPQIFVDIASSEFFNSLGFMVMFYHIHEFGPMSLAKITALRKIASILISIIAFGHVMNNFRITGLSILLVVIFYDFYLNLKKSKPKEKSD